MKLTLKKLDRAVIVYDAECVTDPEPSLFDEEYWARRGAISGTAPGRGSALFLDTEMGPAVLRQYLRGGWPARFSRDRYLFMGWESTRPFREFQLLSQLCQAGLPVPVPLAAYVQRSGIAYRGALLTRQIPGVIALDTLVSAGQGSPELFSLVGACIRRFHSAGASHADLNVRNILVDEPGRKVHLVDFDRGRYQPGKPVNGDAGLARLERSLRKTWPEERHQEMIRAWNSLIEAYRSRG